MVYTSRGAMCENLYTNLGEGEIIFPIGKELIVFAEINSQAFGSGRGYVVYDSESAVAHALDSSYLKITDKKAMFIVNKKK